MKNAETPVFKLILLGGQCTLGDALVSELLQRQHEVTLILDDLNQPQARPGLHVKNGGLASAGQAEQSIAGGSAVVCLLDGLAPSDFSRQGLMTQALLAGMARTPLRRIVLVGQFGGGAAPLAELLQAGGLRWTLVNTPLSEHPDSLAGIAAGIADLLDLNLHVGEQVNFIEAP